MTLAEIAYKSDPGRDPDKQVNEDNGRFGATTLGLLAIVCDGMGGHAGGKEASELAVDTIFEVMNAATAKTAPRDALRAAIEEANRRVWAMPTAEAGYRPGSTVVAALIHEGGAEIAHVGDSRVYWVHSGAISQVTRDHSMVQELVDRNLIRAEDAAKHPESNKILRALGIAKEVDVDVRAAPLAFAAGDLLVLCSDGLSDLVGSAEIMQISGADPPEQAAGKLVDLANARGGHDNITAMVVRFKASAAVREAPTIVKTVQLTTHEAVADVPKAASGTLLSAPLAGASETEPLAPALAPLAPPSSGVAAAIHPPPPSSRDGRRSRASVYGVIGLAVVGLMMLGVFYWNEKRSHRKTPFIVVDLPDTDSGPATTTIDENGDGVPDLVVPPAPPLEAPREAGPHWHGRHHEAGQ
jgi:PPM family protein phosphatase